MMGVKVCWGGKKMIKVSWKVIKMEVVWVVVFVKVEILEVGLEGMLC